MSNIIVFEIQKSLISDSFGNNVKRISKFYEIFSDCVLFIITEKNFNNIDLTEFIFDDIIIEKHNINNFARNRLINNFEDDSPELTLTLMGAGADSKLIKIWRKYAQR